MNREQLTWTLEGHAPENEGYGEDGDIEACSCGWKAERISTPPGPGSPWGSWNHAGYFGDYRDHLVDLLEEAA